MGYRQRGKKQPTKKTLTVTAKKQSGILYSKFRIKFVIFGCLNDSGIAYLVNVSICNHKFNIIHVQGMVRRIQHTVYMGQHNDKHSTIIRIFFSSPNDDGGGVAVAALVRVNCLRVQKQNKSFVVFDYHITNKSRHLFADVWPHLVYGLLLPFFLCEACYLLFLVCPFFDLPCSVLLWCAISLILSLVYINTERFGVLSIRFISFRFRSNFIVSLCVAPRTHLPLYFK